MVQMPRALKGGKGWQIWQVIRLKDGQGLGLWVIGWGWEKMGESGGLLPIVESANHP